MKVYVVASEVSYGDFGAVGGYVAAVFATQEAADNFVADEKFRDLYVEEFEVLSSSANRVGG